MDITVFGTPICPNCKNVTSFLDSAGVGYQYKSIGEDVDKAVVDELVGRAVRSVPVIVSDGVEVTFEDLRLQISTEEVSSALAAMEL